jgi:hypothetical protein
MVGAGQLSTAKSAQVSGTAIGVPLNDEAIAVLREDMGRHHDYGSRSGAGLARHSPRKMTSPDA